MSLERDFQLTEGRLQLEVRAEFSNVFNRTIMADPVTINAQALQLYDPVTKNTSSGFGYINPSQVPGGLRSREGLFIARLRF